MTNTATTCQYCNKSAGVCSCSPKTEKPTDTGATCQSCEELNSSCLDLSRKNAGLKSRIAELEAELAKHRPNQNCVICDTVPMEEFGMVECGECGLSARKEDWNRIRVEVKS